MTTTPNGAAGNAGTNPPAGNAGQTTQTTMLAGKYASPEALETGFRELTKTVLGEEIPAGVKLYGQGGMYSDITALENAYKGRSSLLGKIKTPEPPAGNKPDDKGKPDGLEIKPPAPPVTAKGIAGVLSKAGLAGKEAELANQWLSSGELTAEHYAAFEKAGLDREMVDTFMAGQAAIRSTSEAKIASAVSEAEQIAGGKVQLDNLRKWAAENMQPDRLAALNKMVTNDPGAYPEMIRAISAAYSAKHGSTAALAGDGAVAGGTAPSIPTTLKDYREISMRASAGDKAALAAIDRMKPADIARLMDSPI